MISSPIPYVINSGTVISTDPAITTNGVTDYGKIYRGPADDGAFTLWAYGSTSAFDTELKVDTEFFADTNNLPIAVFKFESLSLTGNPTIDTTSNGVTHLALIGVDGITTGPPGGVLTFAGLDLLVLGTVDGSITLTSDVSFQDLATLVVYARGSNSHLTITSPISNIGDLKLAAEGSLSLSNSGTMSIGEFDTESGGDQSLVFGGSLLLDGKMRLDTVVLPETFVANGANLTLIVNGDFVNSSTSDHSRLRIQNFEGHIGTGGNLSIYVAGDLTTSSDIIGSAPARPRNFGEDFPAGDNFAPGDFGAILQNTSGQIDNGGNIFLLVGSKGSGGNVHVNGLALYLQNYDESANPAGVIGTGGNIDVSIGGNLTADSYVDVFLDNRGGGRIDSGGNLTFNVNGALSIGADSSGFSAEFIISSRYDDSGGNTSSSFIGSDVSLDFHAGSVEMAGFLYGSGISNRGGSVINGNATVTWDVPGSVTIQGNDPTYGGASWFILNDIPPDHQFTPPSGGTIHGDATLDLSIGGDLNVTGYTSIFIDQFRRGNLPTLNGGTIDGNAAINVSAANISIGNDFDVYIGNEKNGGGTGTAGSIGGNATISLSATGDFSTTGYFDPSVLNYNGGNIVGNATISVTAANISSGATIDASIDNRSGDVNGDATFYFNTGNLSTHDAANFFISNGAVAGSPGGQIAGDALISVLASTGIDAGNGAFFAIINDDAGGTTASGTIDGNALVGVIASQLSAEALVASDFNLFGTIHNSGGTIMGDCEVMFDVSGAITTQGRASFDILNFGDGGSNGGGIIGGNATVNVSAGSLTTTTTNGDANFAIYTGSLGHVGGSATITLSLTGDLTTEGDATFIIGNQGSSSENGGTIGSNAMINLNANNISTGGTFDVAIDNSSGGGGLGIVGGTIGGGATINVAAGNITANSFLAQIDNTGGSIGPQSEGGATINMNVSGAATVTTDATVAIYGSDGATFAAINFNGGNYNAGGTFLSYIDGNGTITFNDASAHADVLKAGVFGTNGVLNIGGGILSADSELKLYAPGSNGQLNFVSNVTLGGAAAKILAANSVTIFNNVTVTIGGSTPADVYTNNANYSGFGGNGSTTGTFAGAGANNPQPLASAPPFGAPPPSSTHPSSTAGARPPVRGIHIDNSTQLLALLDSAPTGRNGRVVVDSRPTGNSGNADHRGTNGRALISAEQTEMRNRRAPGGVSLR